MFLVVGANGQLGNELRLLLKGNAVYVDKDELDITDRVAVEDFVKNGNFETIINCAAYTAVDKAENDKALLEQQQRTDLETLKGLQGKIEAMPNKGAGLDSVAAAIEAKVEQLKELEAAYLEKADGNELNRTSENGFAKLFDTDGNVTASDVKKRDIREAINQFKTATDKKAAAQNLKKLWDKAVETNDTDIINNQTLKQAYNIVMRQADLDE